MVLVWTSCHIGVQSLGSYLAVFLSTKSQAPEGNTHTHRKQSPPIPGNTLHLVPILAYFIQVVSQVFARCNLGCIHKAYKIHFFQHHECEKIQIIENQFESDLSQGRFPCRCITCLRQLKHDQGHRHPPCRSGTTQASGGRWQLKQKTVFGKKHVNIFLSVVGCCWPFSIPFHVTQHWQCVWINLGQNDIQMMLDTSWLVFSFGYFTLRNLLIFFYPRAEHTLCTEHHMVQPPALPL